MTKSAVELAMEAAKVNYTVKTEVPNEASKKAEEAAETKKDMLGILGMYTQTRFQDEQRSNVENAVTRMKGVIESLRDDVAGKGDAMALFARTKQLGDILEQLGKDVLPFANAQFVEGGFDQSIATFKKYTPKRSWEYSPELQKEIAAIEAKKKVEQDTKLAKDVTPPVDVLKSKIFSVSLNK